ncbi:MAG: Trk system potassium transporter TrkA [Deltaproteobacteria bacterium]|jgi:trk system potassium uptake protein TrkA|nr:Trk system potassium transporter TrkA [Deltaproteobacteria bacterium]
MKVIVAGAGEVGVSIAEKISREKEDVIVIDQNPERLLAIGDAIDVQTIRGSAARPQVLKDAGVAEADLFVAVTSSDEINILACQLAQILAPESRRAARVRDSEFLSELRETGALEGLGVSLIIDPTTLVVDNILDFLDIPGAGDVVDVSNGRLKLIGLRLPRTHRSVGLTLAEALPREDGYHILIAAIYRNHELLIPQGSTVMKGGDLMYLAATAEHLPQVSDFFGLDWRPVKTVFILGGGEVGLALARRLEERDLTVKLFEKDPERSAYLSQVLTSAIVLKGDATDQSLLEEEGISECDVFIAVGTDDEKNMIACLIAKRLGVPSTITRVNRYNYVPLVSAIGLESLVSARVAAVSAVLKHVRKGLVVSVATLKSEDAEIIEVEVPETSRLAGQTFAAAKFPSGTIVAALLRGPEIVIPRGNTNIEPGDVLVVVTKFESIGQLAKILA